MPGSGASDLTGGISTHRQAPITANLTHTHTITMAAYTNLPDKEQIAKAVELTVFDANGGKVKFGDLVKERKTIVVFIRLVALCY